MRPKNQICGQEINKKNFVKFQNRITQSNGLMKRTGLLINGSSVEHIRFNTSTLNTKQF